MRENEIDKLLVVENVPVFSGEIWPKENIEFPDKIHLSYVGVFEKEIRGIENLLELVRKDDRFVLDIAGVGGGLEEVVKANAIFCKRIVYHGQVDYNTALRIMNGSDFIVALYYPANKYHVYASPNKYYESLYLRKPVITSKNTLVGHSVEEKNTGYTVYHTIGDLENLFASIHQPEFRDSYIRKAENCRDVWNSSFRNYFRDALCGDYIQTLKNL